MKRLTKQIISTLFISLFLVLPVFSEAWYLCLGSYRQESNATNLVNSLKDCGLDAIIDNYTKDSEPYYRVFLADYFKTRDEARDYITELEAKPSIQALRISGIWVCFGSEKLQQEVAAKEAAEIAESTVVETAKSVSTPAITKPVVSESATIAKPALELPAAQPVKKEVEAPAPEKTLKISPAELPPSGAKTFITNQFGVVSYINNMVDEYDLDYLFDDLEDIFDPEDLADSIGEALEGSEYGSKLEQLFEKIETDLDNLEDDFEDTGKINFVLDEKPGKATDLPKGFEADIPQAKLIVQGEVDDPDAPTYGNITAEAVFDLSAKAMNKILQVKNLKANGEVSFAQNPDTGVIDGQGFIEENLELNFENDFFQLNVSNFKNTVSADCSISEDEGSFSANISSLITAFAKFDGNRTDMAEELPFRYFVATVDLFGNASGNPSYDSDENLSGEINCDYTLSLAAGITLNPVYGNGGKVIIQGDIRIDGSIDLEDIEDKLEEIEDYIEDLKDEEKLSEEEFFAVPIPLDINFTIRFYNDANKETLNFLDINSLYDLYSYVYDIAQLM